MNGSIQKLNKQTNKIQERENSHIEYPRFERNKQTNKHDKHDKVIQYPIIIRGFCID